MLASPYNLNQLVHTWEESLGRHVRWALAPLTIAIWFLLAVPSLAREANASSVDLLLLSTALSWLVPVGLGMLACGTVPPERVPAVMRVGWLALGLSVAGYWLCGFAFQFGGVGFASGHPDLSGLAREWTLLGLENAESGSWGIVGLAGTMLAGPAGTPGALRLFWTQLPWITTAVAVFLWSVQGRVWPVQSAVRRPGASGMGVLLVLAGLVLAALYTLVGNWVWGGGWLAHLGANLGLGHGFVDYGGSVAHLLAAVSALAALAALPARAPAPPSGARQLSLPTLDEPEALDPDVRWTARDEPYVPMPALHLPVVATVGAWLALLGWIGWSNSTPLEVIGGPALPWPERTIGLLLAAAGGALCALFASWLTTGEGNSLMTARGVVGALVAASAGLPFYPLWTALAVGAGAGLLVPLAQYAVDHWLRLEDATAAVAVHGVTALWGLLAVGLFAGGQVGAGWNGVGGTAYLGVEGQGVSGYWVAPGMVRDWPGQFQAQAFGVTAIAGLALLVNGVLLGLARGVVRAWHGEDTPERVVRPSRRTRHTRLRLRWPRVRVPVPAWLLSREPGPGQESASTVLDDVRQDVPGAEEPELHDHPEAESLDTGGNEAGTVAPSAEEGP